MFSGPGLSLRESLVQKLRKQRLVQEHFLNHHTPNTFGVDAWLNEGDEHQEPYSEHHLLRYVVLLLLLLPGGGFLRGVILAKALQRKRKQKATPRKERRLN